MSVLSEQTQYEDSTELLNCDSEAKLVVEKDSSRLLDRSQRLGRGCLSFR